MPIRYDGAVARFDGSCTVEEALPLVDWLEGTVAARVDLAACTGLHTALFQVLLAARPAVEAPPDDPFLKRWILPLLG